MDSSITKELLAIVSGSVSETTQFLMLAATQLVMPLKLALKRAIFVMSEESAV
jgi:hypothetical protein